MIFDIISQNIFLGIGIIIIAATLMAYLGRFIRQPSIPMYILAGIILGPMVLGLIKDAAVIHSFEEMGIAFLLFIVGLEMNISRLKSVGKTVLFTGALQVILTFVVAFLLSFVFDYSFIASVYLGLIIAFSSTMIVVKLLSDKDEIVTLHGRIILGILIVQDIFAVLALSVLNSLGNFNIYVIFLALIKGLALFALAWVMSKYIIPSITHYSARSKEMLFLTSISYLFFFAFIAYILDFSIAIGAFIAGMGLAPLPYHFDILGKVKPLKDFFATIFFVAMGMQLVFIDAKTIILPLLLFSILVIFIKPLIIMLIVNYFGYEKRTFFLSGFSLGQISEFSLILAAQGLAVRYLTNEQFSLVLLVFIISTISTAYFIKHDQQLYNSLIQPLAYIEKIFKRKRIKLGMEKVSNQAYIILGAHRIGHIIINSVEAFSKSVLVIDFDPELVEKLNRKGINCMYGDVTNHEILERINFNKVCVVVCTVPNFEDNQFVIEYVKKSNKKVIVFVTAKNATDALSLYEKGADYVIIPHVVSGELVADSLQDLVSGHKHIKEFRNSHIKHLLSGHFIE